MKNGLKLLYINRGSSRKAADKNRKNIKPRVFYEVEIGGPVGGDDNVDSSSTETAGNHAKNHVLIMSQANSMATPSRVPIPYLPQQRLDPIKGTKFPSGAGGYY